MKENLDLERREMEEKRFRMDRTLGIGNLIALIVAIGSVFTWVTKAESTFAVQRVEIESVRAEAERDRSLANRDRGEIMAQLSEINHKLDKLK